MSADFSVSISLLFYNIVHITYNILSSYTKVISRTQKGKIVNYLLIKFIVHLIHFPNNKLKRNFCKFTSSINCVC